MKKQCRVLSLMLACTILQNSTPEPKATRLKTAAHRKKLKSDALKQAEKQAQEKSLREQNLQFNSFYLQQLTRQHNPSLKAEYERQERATATQNLHGYLDILEELKQTDPELERVNWQPIHNEIRHDANLFARCLPTTQKPAEKTILEKLLALDHSTTTDITLKQIIGNNQEQTAIKLIAKISDTHDPKANIDCITAAFATYHLIQSLRRKKLGNFTRNR